MIRFVAFRSQLLPSFGKCHGTRLVNTEFPVGVGARHCHLFKKSLITYNRVMFHGNPDAQMPMMKMLLNSSSLMGGSLAYAWRRRRGGRRRSLDQSSTQSHAGFAGGGGGGGHSDARESICRQVFVALLFANVFVWFLWQMSLKDSRHKKFMQDNFVVSYDALRHGRPWTLVTSCFSHVTPLHLGLNMMTLYFLGYDVLRRYGPSRFLLLYTAGGVCSSLGHVVFSNYLPAKRARDYRIAKVGALGASGSVMAIITVFAAAYPRRIILVNFFLPVPAALLVGLYIAQDIWTRQNVDGVAHYGHLGGALFGLVYYFAKLRRPF